MKEKIFVSDELLSEKRSIRNFSKCICVKVNARKPTGIRNLFDGLSETFQEKQEQWK